MLIIPLNLDSVLLLLHNSKLAYSTKRRSAKAFLARKFIVWVLEVTSQWSPDPWSLKHGREPNWRGIKVQEFDQIQTFFRRNTHQSMKMFLGEKN